MAAQVPASPSTQLTPLQEALYSSPQALVNNENLLKILDSSSQSDPNNVEQIIEACLSTLNPSSQQAGFSAIIILDHCTHNSSQFRLFMEGAYIQHKLFRVATTNPINMHGITSENYQTFQRLQFDLISMLIRFHNNFKEDNSFKNTINKLTKIGKLEEYLKFQQSPNTYLNKNSFPSSNNLTNLPKKSPDLPKQLPDLPTSPKSDQMASLANNGNTNNSNNNINNNTQTEFKSNQNDNNNQNAQNIQNGSAMNVYGSDPSLDRSPAQNDNQTEEKSVINSNSNDVQDIVEDNKYGGYEVEQLVTRQGKITVNYVFKCQKEFGMLIDSYIIPCRNELSNEEKDLTDDRLQSILQCLQHVQKRLAFVVAEVSRDPSLVDLAIKANDSVVQTILWYNSMVKGSRLKGSRELKWVDARVRDNRDLVELQQSLLLYDSKLQSKINKFNQKRAKELHSELQSEIETTTQESGVKDDEKSPVVNNGDFVNNVNNINNNNNNNNGSLGVSGMQGSDVQVSPMPQMEDGNVNNMQSVQDVSGGNFDVGRVSYSRIQSIATPVRSVDISKEPSKEVSKEESEVLSDQMEKAMENVNVNINENDDGNGLDNVIIDSGLEQQMASISGAVDVNGNDVNNNNNNNDDDSNGDIADLSDMYNSYGNNDDNNQSNEMNNGNVDNELASPTEVTNDDNVNNNNDNNDMDLMSPQNVEQNEKQSSGESLVSEMGGIDIPPMSNMPKADSKEEAVNNNNNGGSPFAFINDSNNNKDLNEAKLDDVNININSNENDNKDDAIDNNNNNNNSNNDNEKTVESSMFDFINSSSNNEANEKDDAHNAEMPDDVDTTDVNQINNNTSNDANNNNNDNENNNQSELEPV